MTRAAIFFGILLCQVCVRAQLAPLETDRPDQTESPAIVPTGWIQVESGAQQERIADAESITHINTLPTVLTKFGLTRWSELRLITEREQAYSGERGSSKGLLLPMEIGLKVRLCVERGLRPRTSLIGHIGLPELASRQARTTNTFANFRLTLQNTLSERLTLGYNLGADWDGERPTATFIYTLCLGVTMNARWGVYGEAYGFVSDIDRADHRINGGVTCKLGEHVQLDASGGRSIGLSQWFLGVGLSFRLGWFAPHGART